MSDMTMEHRFLGGFITLPEYADTTPLNVWHRQLEPKRIQGKMKPNLHVLFRNRFTLEETKNTKIFITADDYYKLYINGRYVTQGPAPGFPFRYYYNEIDISEYCLAGENVVAVHTYYQGLINRVWVSGDDRHGLLYDITQKERLVSKSDESVLTALHSGIRSNGIIGYQTQFLESFDSRAPEVGFESPVFDDSAWENAAYRTNPDYTLMKQPTKQLDEETVFPQSIRYIPNGIIIDFGQGYVGYLYLRAIGKSGSKVSVRYAQELDENGIPLWKMRANCTYNDEWILSDSECDFSAYDYKSFRYVLLNFKEECAFTDIHMIARHYPFTCKRECMYPDTELQHIWELCVNSLKYGVQDIIQDCMDREKGQYLGDGAFSSTAFAVLTGDTSMMEKLIDNMLSTSFINRGLMTCAPCSFMQEIAEYVLMMPWLLLSHMHLRGTLDFAAQMYERVADAIDFYRESYEREDYLLHDLDKWCVVDWPEKARDDYDFDLTQGRIAYGTHCVINAYYIGAVKALNRVAKRIGREPYRSENEIVQAFRNAFYDSEEQQFRDTPQSSHSALPSNAFSLCFGLCPDDGAREKILHMITTKEVDKSAFFTSFASLCALKRYGNDTLCREYLKNKGRWLHMISEGATVTFEAWGKETKWNTSLFHLCYSYAVLFLTDWGMDMLWEDKLPGV